MFKLKKVLMVVFAMLILFSVVVLAACHKPNNNGDGGGGEDLGYEEYSYNYGGESLENSRPLEYFDTDITLDGLVDTQEYGTQYLSLTDINGVNTKVYAHMGSDGVFFGFVSNDTHVNYNTANDVYNNTSVELQVTTPPTASTNNNAVRIRLGANGTPELSFGTPSLTGYYFTERYIPSIGVVHINGKLNSGAEGYSAELYLPYTSMGLEVKPESVVCAPAFNTLAEPTSTARSTWTTMLGCDIRQSASWYVVDETGITSRTSGYTEKGTGVLQEKGYNEFYYFGTQPSQTYYLKTTLTVQAASVAFLNYETNPKFGLVNRTEDALQAFYIDAANRTGTNFATGRASQSATAGTNWQWNDSTSTAQEGHWGNKYIAGKSEYYMYRNIALEVIYYKGDLYFIMDGVLVKTVKGFAPATEGAIPGLMTVNTKATFANIEFETDPAKVEAEMAKYLASDITIDGDLSDWTDEAINRHAKTIADTANGNAMTVYAYRGADGLYVAYDVTHKVNNPNVELYVNGNGAANRYTLTALGDGGYIDGALTTTPNAGGTYRTVAEMFIPMTTLVKEGFDPTDTLEVEFAFTAYDGSANSYLNGSSRWTLQGTKLSVLAKGIGEEYTLTYSLGDGDGIIGDAPATEKIFAGDTVLTTTPTFTRDGYTFVGWSDGSNSYAIGDTFVMPSHDVTLVPCWVANGASGEYGVTYAYGALDVEGELPTDTNTYAPGELVTVLGATLTRDGYRFVGWSDGATTYAVGSKLFMGEGALTLTAVWEKLYAVTYARGYANADGSLPDIEYYAEGEVVVIKNTNLTRSGYDFFGWSLPFDNIVYAADDTFIMPAEDVTITAIWKFTITVDGNLNDWNQLDSKTISANSLSDNRRATWYGVLRDDGLYLAVDIYHNQLGYGNSDWWRNLNFEIQLGARRVQHYVYVNGRTGTLVYNYTIATSSSSIQAAYSRSSGLLSAVTHHSTFEVFIPNSIIEDLKEADGSIRIGVAIKTNDENEKLTGGTHNYAEGDPWYMPYGVRADNYDDFAYVTKDGMYLKNEYLHPDWQFGLQSAVQDDGSITVDGDISDWANAKTIAVVGNNQYYGKGATFYGKMTQSGLYLAVEAYHAMFTYGQDEWWNNTNFELRIGEAFTNSNSQDHLFARQYWVYATAPAKFEASQSYMRMASSTEFANGLYHTVIEVFIPAANFVGNDYMVQNGMVHVGFAWKTNDDICNDLGVDGGGGSWWVPNNTHINTNPACVTGDGVYTAKEYQSLVD